MVKLGRKQYLGWALESTAGTAESIANSDYHLVEDVTVELAGDEHERVGNLGSLDNMAGVTGSIIGTISFTTEFRGGGASGTPPVDIPLWKASGFRCDESDYSGGDMVLDQALTTEFKTVTFNYYADGMLWEFKGAVGTGVLTMESGAIGKMAWTFTGLIDAFPADGTNPTPTYNTTIPPVCQNTTLTLDAGTDFGVCTNIEFDLGNEIANRRDMTEAQGYAVPQITRRNSTGSMTVEIPTVANYAWNSKWRNKTKIDGSVAVGSATYNTQTIAWDMVLNAAPNPSDTDGIMIFEIPFILVTNDLAGDNAWTITYT